jgi:hypothetical protein
MRLRPNRTLWGAPPPYSGRGRPRVHGERFKLNEPSTWWAADQVLCQVHPHLGRVQVSLWHQLALSNYRVRARV